MIIYEMTATFGKLEHQVLTLRPGLNVIHAPNEWGKSTWCAFLVAMLYGIDTRAKSTKSILADKEHYAPWSGTPMEGRIDLNWNDMDITIDGETRQYKNVFFIATMNQPFEGGGVAMTPSASDCDETLDFLIFSGVSKLKALCTIPLLYVKKHAGKPGVTLLTGKTVSVTSSAERILHFDGDSLEGCTGFEAKLNGKVKVIF